MLRVRRGGCWCHCRCRRGRISRAVHLFIAKCEHIYFIPFWNICHSHCPHESSAMQFLQYTEKVSTRNSTLSAHFSFLPFFVTPFSPAHSFVFEIIIIPARAYENFNVSAFGFVCVCVCAYECVVCAADESGERRDTFSTIHTTQCWRQYKLAWLNGSEHRSK